MQDYFVSNYTPSYIEDPGLSSNALWADPIFLPAAELLANNEDLLEAIYQINATLVYSLNTGEPSICSFLPMPVSLADVESWGHVKRCLIATACYEPVEIGYIYAASWVLVLWITAEEIHRELFLFHTHLYQFAGDTTVNLAQIFDAYYKLIQNPGFSNASRPANDLSYADQYMWVEKCPQSIYENMQPCRSNRRPCILWGHLTSAEVGFAIWSCINTCWLGLCSLSRVAVARELLAMIPAVMQQFCLNLHYNPLCRNDIFKPLFATYDTQTQKQQQSNGLQDAGKLLHQQAPDPQCHHNNNICILHLHTHRCSLPSETWHARKLRLPSAYRDTEVAIRHLKRQHPLKASQTVLFPLDWQHMPFCIGLWMAQKNGGSPMASTTVQTASVAG